MTGETLIGISKFFYLSALFCLMIAAADEWIQFSEFKFREDTHRAKLVRIKEIRAPK